ncbi:MAG: molybdate transport system substrate-binding protein, partial [Abditibacteriota bacterium]|nr:molybdate transport system substrate-binding protein [Abditibacteriota bacterium]
MLSSLFWCLNLVLVPLGPTPLRPVAAQSSEVVVSAAASLQNALTALAITYRRQNPSVTVRFNFASSGTLQRQVENGAPVDLFIAAADRNMDALAHQKLIVASTRRVLATNALVLIVPRNSTLKLRGFRDLSQPQIAHVAMGAPDSVPAGFYARQLLRRLHNWAAIEAKAVRCKDVREVLTQVEKGNVEAGIVYRSDAAISSRVRVV